MYGVLIVVYPFAKAVPPVGIRYQSTVDPDGGVAVKITVPGPHREVLVAIGAVGIVFIVTVTIVLDADTHPVEVFLDSKYALVVFVITGVVTVVYPFAKAVPPVGARYQSTVDPDGAVAVSITVPGPQRETLEAAGFVGCSQVNKIGSL